MLHVARALEQEALEREVRVLRRQIERQSVGTEIVGKDPALLAAIEAARQVAPSRSTVLVLGETGTGKELIAQLVHKESGRRGPFLAINCAAIPESMLERELFGHERGAFTGADTGSPGLLEAASDGTLFLDEISEMPLAVQAKLLRVLEGQEFLRLGGTKPLRSGVRFVASTNRDLALQVAEKRFRDDLYYRLNVVTVKLPPLRDRGDDIGILAEYQLALLTRETGRITAGFSPEAMVAMRGYSWPGNVREMRNAIERAVLVCDGNELREVELSLQGALTSTEQSEKQWFLLSHREAKRTFETAYLVAVLKACNWNLSRAAARMGIFRKNLHDKIRRLGITIPKD